MENLVQVVMNLFDHNSINDIFWSIIMILVFIAGILAATGSGSERR